MAAPTPSGLSPVTLVAVVGSTATAVCHTRGSPSCFGHVVDCLFSPCLWGVVRVVACVFVLPVSLFFGHIEGRRGSLPVVLTPLTPSRASFVPRRGDAFTVLPPCFLKKGSLPPLVTIFAAAPVARRLVLLILTPPHVKILPEGGHQLPFQMGC